MLGEREVNVGGLVHLHRLGLVRTLSTLKENWRDLPFIEHLQYVRGIAGDVCTRTPSGEGWRRRRRQAGRVIWPRLTFSFLNRLLEPSAVNWILFTPSQLFPHLKK